MSTPAPGKPVYNVKNPFIAKVKKAYDLSGPGAPKNTRHYEIDLTGSGLEYTPGDRLIEVELYGDDAENDEAEPVAAYGIQLAPRRWGYRMTTRGAQHEVRVLPAHVAHLAQHMIEKVPPDLSKFLICPMPGLLVALLEPEKRLRQDPRDLLGHGQVDPVLRLVHCGLIFLPFGARMNLQGYGLAVLGDLPALCQVAPLECGS